MRSKPESIVAAVVVAVCLPLFTVLLIFDKVGGLTYLGLLGLLLLTGVVLHGFSRLRELDLKNLKLTLSEIKEVKAEIEQMYGGIDHLKRAPIVMDEARMQELGVGGGRVPHTGAVMRFVSGCMTRERERLARIFMVTKSPEKLAEAILNRSA